MKNQFKHNDDGTTHIFVESKSKHWSGKHIIIIDTEDWDKVKGCKWSIGGSSRRSDGYPYATTNIPHPDGGWYYYNWQGKERRQRRRIVLQLHHLIMGKPQKGKVIDHINHDGIRTGLDNRKDNLREVTPSQNSQNQRSRKNSSSQYKGVHWYTQTNRWRAKLKHRSKSIHVGYFACEHQAALAYNEKALELWGENALLNEVKTQEETAG